MCINQADVLERNAQVAMMGDIFSHADYVLAWLGPADSVLSDSVMELASRIYSPDSLSVIEESMGFATYSANCRTMPVAAVTGAVFGRDYWSRLWIVQELLLAKDIILMCGPRSCTWLQLRSFQSLQLKICPNAIKLSPNYNRIVVKRASLERLLTYYKHSRVYTSIQETFRLDQLYDHFRGQQCFDPRDRIYGLLGIATVVGQSNPVKVDYQKSPVGLAKELLIYEYSLDKDSQGMRTPFITRVRTLAEGMEFDAQILQRDPEVARILEQDALTYPPGSEGGAVRIGFS